MLPDFSESNPYQAELITALSSLGVTVETASVDWRYSPAYDWVTTGRPAVVHLHWITPFFGTDRRLVSGVLAIRTVIELLFIRMLGATLIWTVHNLSEHESRTPQIDRWFRIAVARMSTRIIVHCDEAHDTVRDHFRLTPRNESKLRTIPHGHYIDTYPNEESRSAARSQLSIPDDATVFLYFGLIRPYKNVPDLIGTVRSMETEEEVILLVVGNPWNDAQAQAVRQAADGDPMIRTVLEYVPNDEIQRYMAAADAVVLPFQSILTSGSVILAMSFGRAVITPDEGCPGQVLGVDGGVTYDLNEANGLKEALYHALDPDVDLDTMGQRNREVVHQFDWSAIGAQTVAVYRGREDRVSSPATIGVR